MLLTKAKSSGKMGKHHSRPQTNSNISRQIVDEATTNVTPGNPMSPMGTNANYRC